MSTPRLVDCSFSNFGTADGLGLELWVLLECSLGVSILGGTAWIGTVSIGSLFGSGLCAAVCTLGLLAVHPMMCDLMLLKQCKDWKVLLQLGRFGKISDVLVLKCALILLIIYLSDAI